MKTCVKSIYILLLFVLLATNVVVNGQDQGISETSTALIYVRTLADSGEFVRRSDNENHIVEFPFNKCTTISAEGNYFAQTSLQNDDLVIRRFNSQEVVIDTAWQTYWNPCVIQWLSDTVLSIGNIDSAQGSFEFDISSGALTPTIFQPISTEEIPNLPNWLSYTNTNFVLPSPQHGIFLYERCNGQQTSASGKSCGISTDFVIYNTTDQSVLKVLDNADPSLIRGYESYDSLNLTNTYSTASWSGNGRYLAFQSYPSTQYDYFNLNIYDLSTNQYLNTEWINAHIDNQRAMQWSPVDNKLAFWILGRVGEAESQDNADTLRTLIIYDADTKAFTVAEQPINLAPTNLGKIITWSPDGSKLVFVDQTRNLINEDSTSGIESILDDKVDRVLIWKIETATATPTSTAIPSPTLTATYTLAPTDTPTATDTPTETLTSVPLSTSTAIATETTTPTTSPTSGVFPTTGILDNFNRANGTIGSNWTGTTGNYSISSNQLQVGNDGDIYWNGDTFGTGQEVGITLASINTSASEIDLLLKVQGSSWTSGTIEVVYNPSANVAQVWTYTSSQDWVQRGADLPVTFVAGDVFGARAKSDGTVEVYKNSTLLGSRDISAWPYYANGGTIGLWTVGANSSILDDFRGGNFGTAAVTPTATSVSTTTITPSVTNTPANFPTTGIVDTFNRANGVIGSNWAGTTGGYSIVSNHLQVNDGETIYWNGATFGANQEAYVTLNTLNMSADEIDLLLNGQGNYWGDGILEIWYRPTLGVIQVMTYEISHGWVQHGADISVTFAAGDRFGARAKVDGTVEVYQNNTLLGTRDITAWTYYANGGYIGLWMINASGTIVDDFGGGNS